MAEETFLADDLLRQLISVGEVDLLVGLSTHSSGAATRQAIQTIEQSFQQFFVRQRVVIVTVDGAGIEEAASTIEESAPSNGRHRPGLTSLRTIHRVRAEFSSPPQPGVALRTFLAAADLLRAKACAVVSPATTSLTPEWVANLLRPSYKENFDFVAPTYTRDRYQGLLVRNVLYPMGRATFGKRIRELFSDEWGFSGRLATMCLNKDVWHEQTIRNRPEAWMAVSGIAADYRCCQAYLGPRAQPANVDLVDALRQTVGGLFWLLEAYPEVWLDRETASSEAVTSFGPDHELTSDPAQLDMQRIFEMFRSGVSELQPILKQILSPDTHAGIERAAAMEPANLSFEDELWVRTLYDFACAYHHTVMNRDHLVQALVPLYRGKIYSFLVEHSDASSAQMEEATERLCLEFERLKPYLRERWKEKFEVKT